MKRVVAKMLWLVPLVVVGVIFANDFSLFRLLEASKCLAELSTLLFGVIGMWISLLYRDEIITNLWAQKDGEEQLRAARLVVVAQDRCKILCRGLYLSAIVLVALYGFILWGGDIVKLSFKILKPSKLTIEIVKYALSFMVAGCGFVQLYVLLSCIAPMMFIMRELKSACDFAKRVIALNEGGESEYRS